MMMSGRFRSMIAYFPAYQRFLLIPIFLSTAAWAEGLPQIPPLLQKNCLMCHGEKVKQGGLDLSSRNALLRGGDNGPVIQPGDATSSLLYKLVAHQREPGMPYKTEKLPDPVIAQFADWINTAARYGDSPAN